MVGGLGSGDLGARIAARFEEFALKLQAPATLKAAQVCVVPASAAAVAGMYGGCTACWLQP